MESSLASKECSLFLNLTPWRASSQQLREVFTDLASQVAVSLGKARLNLLPSVLIVRS